MFQISLSRSGAVSSLASTAMRLAAGHLVITTRGRTVEPGPGPREQTLKVVLSALWNLSAHCRKNKVNVSNQTSKSPLDLA